MACDKAGRPRLRRIRPRAILDRDGSRAAVARASELPLAWQTMELFRVLPDAADRSEFPADEPPRVAREAPLAGRLDCWNNFQRLALAESRTRAFDARRWNRHGVDVRP